MSFDFGSVSTYDEFIRALPPFFGTQTLLNIPRNEETLVDYRPVSATEFNLWIDSCATLLSQRGFPPVPIEDKNTSKVGVSVLLQSGIDLIINQLALNRLGYSPLLTSTRLSANVLLYILDSFEEAPHPRILHSGFDKIVTQCKELNPKSEISEAISFKEYSNEDNLSKSINFSASKEESETILRERSAYYAHSSGSTGYPKLIRESNKVILDVIKNVKILGTTLNTAPIFHMLGAHACEVCFGQKLTTYLFNYAKPVTPMNIIKTLQSQKNVDHIITVPYIAMLMLESEEGVEVIKRLNVVTAAGAKVAQEIGDKMMKLGTRLNSVYGATETGVVMSSHRPTDKEWEWLSPYPGLEDHLEFIDQKDGSYELHLKEDFPMRCLTNAEDGGWDTSDLFVKHPEHNWYKYLGRNDDRVTLSTGEKVLTIPIEYQIRLNPLIKECAVFGIGKEMPGLFVIPVEKQNDPEKFLEEIWPTIVATNENVEQFSRIIKEMVHILPYDVEYPVADKGTIKRGMFYKKFAKEIEEMYEKINSSETIVSDDHIEKAATMSLKEIEYFIIEKFKEVGIVIPSSDMDIFKLGADSLQVVSVWGHVNKEIYSGMKRSTFYEYSTVKDIASFIYLVFNPKTTNGNGNGQSQSQSQSENDIATIKKFIDRYSSFKPQKLTNGKAYSNGFSNKDGEEYILLTGASGSLGAFVLKKLLALSNVKKIYCLVRADTKEEAQYRVLKSFESRNIKLPKFEDIQRVVGIPFDSGKESDIKECLSNYAPELFHAITSIIHCAWPVNFNYRLTSFESHIKNLNDLINLALGSKRGRPAKIVFCSSISTALLCPTPVPESVIDVHSAAPMGYGQSKLVCEHIIKNACQQTGIYARSARIGQIVGDTQNGIWNATEAYPLMIQSAKVLKALPNLSQSSLSWTPVDTVADVLLDILFNGEEKEKAFGVNGAEIVYNVTTPKLIDWNEDLLPTLKNKAGLDFEVVDIKEWLKRLANSPNDAVNNPTIKLLDYFDKMYNSNQQVTLPMFTTSKTETVSPSLSENEDIVNSGLVEKFVRGWGM